MNYRGIYIGNYWKLCSIYIYIYSPRIRDAGIAIESSGGAYVYISDDMGRVVSVVAVPGLGTSRGGVHGAPYKSQELTRGGARGPV